MPTDTAPDISGFGSVVITQRRGKEGTFSYFIDPIDLGTTFTAFGCRHMVVRTERGLASLQLDGNGKHEVVQFCPSVKISDITPPQE